MAEKDPWFVVERSEALIGLLLTSREDVRIRDKNATEGGPDLLVEIKSEVGPSTRFFMVQVKGTTSPKTEDWLEGVRELFRTGNNSLYLPTCVFVVDVRGNRAHYAWLAEPFVKEGGAGLHFVRPDSFLELDRAAVDTIVERVKAWYAALPRQLLAT